MSKKVWLLIILGLLLVVLFFWRSYNRLVTGEEKVKMEWSQVENQYQRRSDLILNLVETVKGYAKHESETLTKVVEARAAATQVKVDTDKLDAESIQKFNAVQGELAQAVSRLLVTVESYPDLKASENFVVLQSQLEGTENRIALVRKQFNEAVNDYNTYRRRFPSNIIANFFGFGEKGYFEATDTEPVKVQF